MSTPGPCRLSASTSAGYAELLIRHRIDRALARPRNSLRDRGASVVEWVIISAVLVTIAVGVGAILLESLTAKAESIDLDTGTP